MLRLDPTYIRASASDSHHDSGADGGSCSNNGPYPDAITNPHYSGNEISQRRYNHRGYVGVDPTSDSYPHPSTNPVTDCFPHIHTPSYAYVDAYRNAHSSSDTDPGSYPIAGHALSRDS